MTVRKLALLAAIVAASATSQASALEQVNTWWLTHAVTAEKIQNHLKQLQRIATRNDNTRALGTPGYSASVRYVVERMKKARYKVEVQPFIASLFTENNPSVLTQVSPTPTTYVHDVDFTTMEFSGDGVAEGPLALAPGIDIPPTGAGGTTASGCDPDAFPDMTGKIVLVQRGACTFQEKAENAAANGAVGVIIFNEGQPGRQELLSGTLAEEQQIPVVGTTYALGEILSTQVGAVMHIEVNAVTTLVQTWNVLAEKRGRVHNQDVIVGAHLDSVADGPGINDNGSGSATLLTIAEQMTNLHIRPRNTVRFAFWGAEEQGLIGSTHYVDTLSQGALARIALNLNFDMLGSPNFVRFVYDGDGDIGDPGPPGSDVIEDVFTRYFHRNRQASEPTEFDGRSDYLAFILNGIPAGGLFSGAEGIKTPAQKRLYGGTAGAAYDPCYHQACDNIHNLSRRSLDQLGKAAAHAVMTFAMMRENIRPPEAETARIAGAALSADYRGPHLIR